jgi:hypothetical protein
MMMAGTEDGWAACIMRLSRAAQPATRTWRRLCSGASPKPISANQPCRPRNAHQTEGSPHAEIPTPGHRLFDRRAPPRNQATGWPWRMRRKSGLASRSREDAIRWPWRRSRRLPLSAMRSFSQRVRKYSRVARPCPLPVLCFVFASSSLISGLLPGGLISLCLLFD